MLNVTNQGNANQRHNEILLQPCQDGNYLKNEKTSVGKDMKKLERLHTWWECKMVWPL